MQPKEESKNPPQQTQFGLSYKISKRGLKQLTFIFSQLQMLEVPEEGVNQFGSYCGLFLAFFLINSFILN